MRNTDFLLGAALGAGLMYILDPERGGRRRALVRDKAVHFGHEIDDNVTGRARDLRNRARGAVAETRARMNEGSVDGPVLEERVRSELGRAVSNPGSIRVDAVGAGRVMLSGPVLKDEQDELLDTVRSVRGVEEVDNRLDVRESRGDTPGMQV